MSRYANSHNDIQIALRTKNYQVIADAIQDPMLKQVFFQPLVSALIDDGLYADAVNVLNDRGYNDIGFLIDNIRNEGFVNALGQYGSNELIYAVLKLTTEFDEVTAKVYSFLMGILIQKGYDISDILQDNLYESSTRNVNDQAYADTAFTRVQLIMNAGANPNMVLTSVNESLLIFAFKNNAYKVFRYLMTLPNIVVDRQTLAVINDSLAETDAIRQMVLTRIQQAEPSTYQTGMVKRTRD
jgi:hypothetical protein